MRIAICFNGQIRTGVEASENIIRFIGDLYPYCDFFIHTWNKNSQKNYAGTRIYPPEEYVSSETIEKIKEIYQPKKMVVENFDNLKSSCLINSRSLLKNNVHGQWYSFNKVNKYKTEYEEENNFKYDLVAKFRFDVIYPDYRNMEQNYNYIKKNINNMIYLENPPPIESVTEDLVFINDEYYLGSSKNIDIVANFYNQMDVNISKNNLLGYYFFNYLNDNHIIFYDGEGICDMFNAVYRPECLKYSSMSEFKKCFECDHYYYNPEKDSIYGQYWKELLKKYEIENIFDLNNKVFTNELKIRKGYEDSSLY